MIFLQFLKPHDAVEKERRQKMNFATSDEVRVSEESISAASSIDCPKQDTLENSNKRQYF